MTTTNGTPLATLRALVRVIKDEQLYTPRGKHILKRAEALIRDLTTDHWQRLNVNATSKQEEDETDDKLRCVLSKKTMRDTPPLSSTQLQRAVKYHATKA